MTSCRPVRPQQTATTRPWLLADATTSAGTGVRFTAGPDGEVHAILLDVTEPEFAIRGIDAAELDRVRMLGLDAPVDWRVEDGTVTVRLPERLPVSPAHVLTLGPGVRPAG